MGVARRCCHCSRFFIPSSHAFYCRKCLKNSSELRLKLSKSLNLETILFKFELNKVFKLYFIIYFSSLNLINFKFELKKFLRIKLASTRLLLLQLYNLHLLQLNIKNISNVHLLANFFIQYKIYFINNVTTTTKPSSRSGYVSSFLH